MARGAGERNGWAMNAPEKRENVAGTIYLLHFERPYRHARHYLGWTEGESIDRRIEEHRSGRGSRLMAAVSNAGIDFRVARTWSGTRHEERRLKNGKNTGKWLCPDCKEGA